MRNLADDTILSGTERALLQSVKDTVRSFIPDAEVLLYGSVARGDHRPDSDFDLLVLTERKLSRIEEEKIEDAIYDIQLGEGVLIVASFLTQEIWRNNPFMPLHREIEKDAVLL